MDGQSFAIAGQVVDAADPRLQRLLEQLHGTPVRPRCMCVPGGVEMYVARHLRYLVKRLPGTGRQHLPSCPAYEFDPACSGRAALGNAVVEQGGQFVLRVDFPWSRSPAASPGGDRSAATAEPAAPRAPTARGLGLRALTHFLWEEAGFHRWSPAMEGKRNQAVLAKYLGLAASTTLVHGRPLGDRLYVPEPFHQSTQREVAERRREKLAFLRPAQGRHPLALLIGEYRSVEPAAAGVRIWIRHLPDVPLLASASTWRRLERASARALEYQDADGPANARLLLTALVRARSENVYELDAGCLTLASAQWIPVDHHRELPLLEALVSQRRRFMRPLRYNLRGSTPTPTVLLLDAGRVPVKLFLLSPFMDACERHAVEAAIAREEAPSWVWDSAEAMPDLPAIEFPGRPAAAKGDASRRAVAAAQAELTVQGEL